MQLGYYKNITDCFKTVIRKEGMGAVFEFADHISYEYSVWHGCRQRECERVSEFRQQSGVTVQLHDRWLSCGGHLRGSYQPSGCYQDQTSDTVSGADVILSCHPSRVRPVVERAHVLGPAVAESAGTSILQNSKLKGAFQAARQIASEEGLRGFQRGIVTCMMVHAPAWPGRGRPTRPSSRPSHSIFEQNRRKSIYNVPICEICVLLIKIKK